MQIGSGTWDVMPAIAFTGQLTDFSWGLQTEANVRTVLNRQGYALGNDLRGNGWVSYRFSKWMSSSLRLEEKYVSRLNGFDPQIAVLSANDPASDASNYGGASTTAYFGLNLFKPTMPFRGNRIMLEYGVPVYQNLNGTQMSYKSSLWLGWQYNF
jgi:hypothetical protein